MGQGPGVVQGAGVDGAGARGGWCRGQGWTVQGPGVDGLEIGSRLARDWLWHLAVVASKRLGALSELGQHQVLAHLTKHGRQTSAVHTTLAVHAPFAFCGDGHRRAGDQ